METEKYLKGSNLVIDPTDEVKAVARYIRMSPFKVRRVLDQIRGLSYGKALIILEFMPYRACEQILKVLRSAVANAEHNRGLDPVSLAVSQAYADAGPSLKRYRPRAQGRAYQIHKPTCHITICVAPQVETSNRNKTFYFNQQKTKTNNNVVEDKNETNSSKNNSIPENEKRTSYKDFMNKIDPYVIFKLGLFQEAQTANYSNKEESKDDRDTITVAMTVRVKDHNKKLKASSLKSFKSLFKRGDIIGCIGNKEVVKALQNDHNVESVEASIPGSGFDGTVFTS